tara:strand:+ start:3183 stop:3365 length:183 start_codon:yes stop_codon:yes gene_type:complete
MADTMKKDSYDCWKVYYSGNDIGYRVIYSLFGKIQYERIFNTKAEAHEYIKVQEAKNESL